jgi:hypothetical protein
MNRLFTALVATAAVSLAACSGGGSNVQPPAPTGKYSLASLNGTYAFMTSGESFAGSTVNPMARVGSFVADGKGSISGGVEDVNTVGSPSGAITISGGSYTVSADGRGTLTLNFQSGNSITLGMVLTSTSDGLIIDETSTASQASTGSGNFVLQNSSSFNVSAVNGSYVFDFSGLDANKAPESFAGQFNASSGVISSGIFDDNDNFTLASGSMTPGTIAQDPLNPSTLSSFGRGVATIAGQQFVFYIADSNRVRFLSTSGGMLSGDAVLQATVPASPSGSFALIVAGSSVNGGLTRIGRLTVSSGAVNNILMDVNDAGMQTQLNNLTNGTVSYDATTGRGTISFQSTVATYTFVFYLSSSNSGVIQEQTAANNVPITVADGSILGQTGAPFSSSNVTGPYALNWSGLSVQQGGSFATQDEEDLLAQANITSLALSGTADIFQFTNGVPQTNFGLGGTITLGGDGTGSSGQRNTMVINLHGANPINFVVYFASPQLALFANTSSSGPQRIVAGILKAQQ